MMDYCPTIKGRRSLFNSSHKHSNPLSSPMQTVASLQPVTGLTKAKQVRKNNPKIYKVGVPYTVTFFDKSAKECKEFNFTKTDAGDVTELQLAMSSLWTPTPATGTRACCGFSISVDETWYAIACPFDTTLSKDNGPTKKATGAFQGFCHGCSRSQANMRGNLLVSFCHSSFSTALPSWW